MMMMPTEDAGRRGRARALMKTNKRLVVVEVDRRRSGRDHLPIGPLVGT